MPEFIERIEHYLRVKEDLIPLNQEKIGKKSGKEESHKAKKPLREEPNDNGKKTSEGINTVCKDLIYKILP